MWGEGEAGPEGAAGPGVREPPVLPVRPLQGEAAPVSRRPLGDLCALGRGGHNPPGPCRAPHFLRAPVWILPARTSVEPGSIHSPAGGSWFRERLRGPWPHRSGEAGGSGAEGPALTPRHVLLGLPGLPTGN